MEKYEGFEIDREALVKTLGKMILFTKMPYDRIADEDIDYFISTMPTWLKRIE